METHIKLEILSSRVRFTYTLILDWDTCARTTLKTAPLLQKCPFLKRQIHATRSPNNLVNPGTAHFQ